ncbi:hypothetical protein BDV93DRAFT_546232 [Ceratobasidium sp. AG-I]|nr:hypothetical protein BDV93DRAFT_546232 [Ceratobasidium sp. AG-I]
MEPIEKIAELIPPIDQPSMHEVVPAASPSIASGQTSADEKKRAKKARQKEKYMAKYHAIEKAVQDIISKKGVEWLLATAGLHNAQSGSATSSTAPTRPSEEEIDTIILNFIKHLVDEESEPSGSESEQESSNASDTPDNNLPNRLDVLQSHNEVPTDKSLGANTLASNYIWEANEYAMDLEEDSSPPSSEMEPILSDLESNKSAVDTEADEEASPSSPMAMDPSSPLPQSSLAPQTSPTPQSSPAPQSSPTPQSSSSSDSPMEEDRPGAPLCSYVPALERLHRKKLALGEDPATPFADYLEFEFVKWMIEHDVSQNSREKLIKLPLIATRAGLSFKSNYRLNVLLDELPTAGPKWRSRLIRIEGDIMGPDGEPIVEEVELWTRDILEVIQELLENVTYGKDMVFEPRTEYSDADRTERCYTEMWTGDWWRKIQDMLPLGATVLPVILSSDATHLTNLSAGKKAWPIYISLGNIPKHIRRKPGSYSTLLLGYLPCPIFDCFSKKAKTHEKEKLFHACMREVVRPLEDAGNEGVEMDCGDGFVRKCFPILAAYIADNPEQTMIACCAKNLCYRCICPRDQRGNLETHPDRQPSQTSDAVQAQAQGHVSTLYTAQGLRPFGTPFWTHLPFTNISTALTPDILHQLHKGVFRDHLMNWCLELVDNNDVDNRFKAMPSHSTLRHFRTAVTRLPNTTGKEHKAMEKVFIGVMAGLVHKDVMDVIVAALDFIYYSQLTVHSTITLRLMDDALHQFHAAKNIFVTRGVREHFNINKIHSMVHYSTAIRELGTMDGYNTESPERLHIEFAKRAYKATNRNDFFRQMTDYLERRERVFKFDAYLRWAVPEYDDPSRHEGTLMDVQSAPGWKIAKRSPFGPVAQTRLLDIFGIQYFAHSLEDFLGAYYPDSGLEVSAHDHLTVFPKATQHINDIYANDVLDIIHASPHASTARLASLKRDRKFDTVLIKKDDIPLDQTSYGMSSHRVGQVRMLFTLPPKYGINVPLAYIYRFNGPSSRTPIQLTGMYRFKYERYGTLYDHNHIEEIVPVSSIRRSCHLIPLFGSETEHFSTSTSPSLESFEDFYLNSYLDYHSFQMIY